MILLKFILRKIKIFLEIFFSITIKKKIFPISINKNYKIPLIIYQSWFTNSIPRTLAREINKFRKLNPDVKFYLYDDSEVNRYMKRFYGQHKIYEIFKKAKYWQIKTDIFRYCILFERGGFWLDIKSIINVQLSKILSKDVTMVWSFEKNKFKSNDNHKIKSKLLYKNNFICNWFLGSQKKNIILKNVINNICVGYPMFKNKVFDNPKDAILEFSGPRLFTNTIRKFFYHNNNKIKIQQAGIDIYGHGHYHAPGTSMLYYVKRHYSLDKSSKIFN